MRHRYAEFLPQRPRDNGRLDVPELCSLLVADAYGYCQFSHLACFYVAATGPLSAGCDALKPAEIDARKARDNGNAAYGDPEADLLCQVNAPMCYCGSTASFYATSVSCASGKHSPTIVRHGPGR